jgi:hypothetical protein
MKKFNFIWIVYVLMLLVTVMSASAVNLTNGLISYWAFDEGTGTTTEDSHGSNNISLSGSGFWTSGGLISNAINIAGSSSNKGVVSASSDFSVPDGEKFSFSVWVYRTTTGNWDTILFRGRNTANEVSMRFHLINDDKFQFGYCPTSGSCQAYTSTNAITTVNDWVHLGFTYTYGSGNVQMYVNGQPVSGSWTSGTGTVSPHNANLDLTIGHQLSGTDVVSNIFRGRLDEMGIWIGTILSDDDFENLFNNNDGFAYPFTTEENFSVSLKDKNTGLSIDDFSIIIDSESYSTTDGTITTHLYTNDTSLYNISFYNINGSGGDASHFNFVAENINVSSNYEGEAEQFILNVSDFFSGESLNGSIYADPQVCIEPPCSLSYVDDFVNGVYKGVLGEPSVKERDLLLVVSDYYNKSFVDYDLLTPLITNMTPLYYLYDESFTGFFNYSSDLYVRQLNYSIRAVCPTFINSSFLVNINNESTAYSPSCNNETSFLIQGTYTHDEEGLFNISFTLRNDEDNETFNVSNTTFISDLYDPVINASMVLPEGFNNVTSELSLQCVDNVTPLLLYNMTYNSDVMFFGNKTANTTQSNTSNVNNGDNVLLVSCTDFFGSSSETISENAYFKTINLIDEVDNVPFVVSNLSSARLYYDDNSSFYDFKDEDKNSVNFSSTTISQLRLELGYPENIFITRWIDVSLFNNIDPIRLCANKDNVVHFEQFITSSVSKTVFLKNIYANCYVAGDKTRFAFKDGLILRAYTISGSYSLFTVDGLEQVLLASVDGAIQSDIFLDQLQFRRESFVVSILPDLISFSKKDTPDGALRIYYLNSNFDNYGLTINIKTGETGDLLFSESSFVNYNEANILFNYATISGINESTLLVLEIIKEDSEGGETTLRRYFNTSGSTGQFRSELAGFIALFVLIFGFTFTSSNQTFGWFGMIIAILTFGFLSFALSAWYIVFLQALSASLIIYCVVMLSKDSARGFFT